MDDPVVVHAVLLLHELGAYIIIIIIILCV